MAASEPHGRPPKRWLFAGTAAAVLLVVVASVVVVESDQGAGHPSTSPTTTTTLPGRNVAAPTASTSIPAATLLAAFHGPVPAFGGPGGPRTGTVSGTWYGRPLVSPVLVQRDGYLQVRLPQRPNGSTAWVPASAVTLESTPYEVVVDLATRHLDLYDAGALVLDAPAGIGVDSAPTPTGHFFLAFIAAAPSPAWGPFVMVTSGHSTAISDWEQSGDAIMAIHGPLGAGAAIGTTGAQVSHGCVRLHVSDLQQMRAIPVGSPIDVIA